MSKKTKSKKKEEKVEQSQEVTEETPQEVTESSVETVKDEPKKEELKSEVKKEDKKDKVQAKSKEVTKEESKQEFLSLGKTELSKEEDARVRDLYKQFVGRRGHRIKRVETISQQDVNKLCRNGQFLLKLGNLAELLKK